MRMVLASLRYLQPAKEESAGQTVTQRADIVLRDGADRALAARWIRDARPGSRVTFKGPQRNLDQNAKMWSCLTDIARQCRLNERRWTVDQWKCIFLEAIGRETELIPSLDGRFIPYGRSSSDLSVAEMSELLDFIGAWGTENGVTWSDPAIRELEEQGT